MKHDTQYDTLEALDNWELVHDNQDIRGLPLVTEAGKKIGIIDDLLVDRDGERVAAVRLKDERACGVECLEIHDDRVVYHEAGRAAATATTAATAATGAEKVKVVEEELVVGTREVEGDTIRVRSRVVSDDVSEQVSLRTEDVDVTSRKVGDRISAETADELFEGKTVSVTEVSEEAVVGKVATVTDEIVVSKDVDVDVETVTGTVRRTEVDIDKTTKRDKR